MFEYMELYKNSLFEELEIEKVVKLQKYFVSNRDGLLPYHLAKILAKKCSGKLDEVTKKLQRPVLEEEKVAGIWNDILLSAKAPKKDGLGYHYPVMGHMVGLEMRTRGDRRKLNAMAGY